jgi:hypothetical protein
LPPLVVAVIGASNDRAKFGNKAVRAYLQQEHKVYPVNPREQSIEGLPAYRTVLDIPEQIDRVTFYVPPQVGLKIIEEVAKKGAREVYFNPGSESDELVDKAKALGLNAIVGCSILAIGLDPANL